MNIAIFTNNYLPNPFGVSSSIESFREEFEALGHRVYIFAPRWKDYVDKNPRVFRYPSLDIELRIRFPLAVPYSSKLDEVLSGLDLDIIHAQHPNLLGSAALKWARKKRIPLIFTWHTLYDRYANFVPIFPARWVSAWTIRNAVRYADKADVVIVPSDSAGRIIRGWGVEKEAVAIPTGIREEEFENPDGGRIRKKYEIKDGETLLLLVSRLTGEKNIMFVLESLKEILEKESRVRLMVVGDGYLLPDLKEYARENGLEGQVVFSGIVDRREIKDYYAAGDIFVYASKSETQGMIVTEAMLSGLPIVSLAAPGIVDQVEDGGNGFLTKEDPQAFAEAVSRLIGDKPLRDRMALRSKEIARGKYISGICARKMLEVYEKAIRDYNH